MDPHPNLEYDNDNKKGELIELLKTRTAVLMVGAGSSTIVGYPRWKQLVMELRDKFYPGYQDPYEGIDLSEYANTIKNNIIGDEKKLENYYQFLSERFQPFEGCYTSFHMSLVNLGFCGIITTNYDKILEIALQASAAEHGNSYNCEPRDLCEKKPYFIFPFLRSLNSKTDHASVLHLHGYYHESEDIILTSKDYEKKYGLLDENGNKSQIILDSIHRKVIWALLATHHHLFVGFSLTDPFFKNMIEAVNFDFKLGARCSHYAIMGYRDDTDMSRTIEELKRLGICPIFFKIDIKQDETEDHITGLIDLISEIEDSLLSTSKFVEPDKKSDIIEDEVKNTSPTSLPSLSTMNKITGSDE